jgi:hypothetical protein
LDGGHTAGGALNTAQRLIAFLQRQGFKPAAIRGGNAAGGLSLTQAADAVLIFAIDAKAIIERAAQFFGIRTGAAAACIGGLGGGAFRLALLPIRVGLFAARDFLREFLILPTQFLQPGGAVHPGLLLRGADQAATDGAAPWFGGQALAFDFSLKPGDLRAQRRCLRTARSLLLGGQQKARAAPHAIQHARSAGQRLGQRIGKADGLIEPGKELIRRDGERPCRDAASASQELAPPKVKKRDPQQHL